MAADPFFMPELTLAELEELHRKRMAEWEYLGSEEYRLKIARDVIAEATAEQYNTPEESEG